MSDDDYFPSNKGKRPSRHNDLHQEPDVASSSSPSPTPANDTRFMTVGNGPGSQHTAQLQAMLSQADSGYGGSSTLDPVPTFSPMAAETAMNPNRHQHAAVHQLWYNQHRLALGRSITRVIELLNGLQQTNATWPAHYPSVQRAESDSRSPHRPSVQHSFSSAGGRSSSPPPPSSSSSSSHASSSHSMLRRAMTSLDDAGSSSHHNAESSRSADSRASSVEPRLVTPQIAQEFSVLKLDLKLGSLHQAELVHSLEKSSIASLLEGKVKSSVKHLLALRERIEDTSSKVLITGDLNAGKSTFCNALLRRKILPEDQQPCTAIFCEVLDSRENMGKEEVHAVHKEAAYDRSNEATYDVYTIDELEKIVVDNDRYNQCKVYVKDARRIDQSLLNNGVVDIALIDAPGLNSDTTKTTAIFARQEEIDVVVFVVSAANHFTLTANEFIMSAAAEKAYFFIVVNGYDNIRDKERCQRTILKQVRVLSPQTSKEEAELVHFVSSNAIPTAPPPPGSSSGGGGDGDGDDDHGKGKGKGKDVEKIRDFERLEESLRRFVLEKRAKSKLAPAKRYLLNILNDVHVLANVNSDVAKSELDRVTQELSVLEPQLASGRKARSEVGERVEATIDETCNEIYDYSRNMLSESIAGLGEANHGVQYPGVFSVFDYAEELKEAMLAHVVESVTHCEDFAREKTVEGVNIIKQLGILHLGNEYQNLTFRSDVMFVRKRHLQALARQVQVPTEIWDFADWSMLMQKQEKVAGTGMALTLATALGSRVMGLNSWMDHAMSAIKIMSNDNLSRLIVPGVIVAAVAASFYVLNQIPNSLPHRLSAKVSAQLSELDFVHANASRISGSARKVLRIPADNLRVGMEQSLKELGERREETLRVQTDSRGALKYFSNLVRESAQQRTVVEGVDLDAPPPGVAAGH